ncbi:hypothetical protein QBC37DRAFT_389045 [Rhypophila decipiens]|uniref:Uncharacterized protein n=1 Tax=Rhypophila decipiens TaxID=261697 RepID=A0AAN7B6R7_9PEZI|nr:hypothetical protein QBC37DRAFT_389045 [Rhypophila decipiens]
MRAFTAVLLSLAAIASAAPSAGNNAADALEARQECIYSCGCSAVNGVPGNTQGCCTTTGGTFDGNLCGGLTVTSHTTFKGCCAGGNAVCFAPRGCPL